jgi:AcrR family transcriptional regulator
VTKGGFYGHYADRNALLEDMLDTWERKAIDEVLERVERQGGDARVRLRRAGALTFSRELLPIDLAVRDWSRRDHAVAERLRRVDNRRMEYLRSLISAFCSDTDDVEAQHARLFVGDRQSLHRRRSRWAQPPTSGGAGCKAAIGLTPGVGGGGPTRRRLAARRG